MIRFSQLFSVNAGLLWINYLVYEREKWFDPNYDRGYFYKGGAISLGLTLVNIVLVRFRPGSNTTEHALLPIKVLFASHPYLFCFLSLLGYSRSSLLL